MKMKMMMEAMTFREEEPKRFSKKSGMVALPRCCVMMRVRRPSTTQASREPITAFPRPTQVEAMPKRQPNCPA